MHRYSNSIQVVLQFAVCVAVIGTRVRWPPRYCGLLGLHAAHCKDAHVLHCPIDLLS